MSVYCCLVLSLSGGILPPGPGKHGSNLKLNVSETDLGNLSSRSSDPEK